MTIGTATEEDEKPQYPALWSEKDKELVVKLWTEGASLSNIGKTFGKSRNSVAGIIHRLGIKRSPELNKAALKARPITKGARKPRPMAIRKPPVLPHVFFRKEKGSSAPVDLLDLLPHHCRYPLDLPSGKRKFCGEAKAWVVHIHEATGEARIGEVSYCRRHAEKCFRNAQDLIFFAPESQDIES